MGVRSAALVALVGVLATSGVASAQYGDPGAVTSVWPGFRLIGGFLLTIVVGTIILATKPRWTRVTTNHLENNVAKSTIVGIAVVVLVGILVGALVATGVGAVIGVPIFLVFVVVVFVGTAIAALAMGRVAAGAFGAEGEWAALGVGALCFGVLSAIPLLGQLASFLITSAGVGFIFVRWFGTP